MYRRMGWLALIGFGVFGFGTVILGPDTVDPLLRIVLRLQTPEPVAPAAVPGADVVADRVKREIAEAEVRALMASFTQYESRVPGYPGHTRTAAFIEERFRALGHSPKSGNTSPDETMVNRLPSSTGDVTP